VVTPSPLPEFRQSDGTNSSAVFVFPLNAADSSGNLYVTDEGNDTIRELTSSGTNWVTKHLGRAGREFAQQRGTNGSARFNEPYALS